ncbi:exopolysaccharide transport family protein [Bradyrhizobium sp.]|uniref:GumC family protein n=1 Tax=Bradyrhizobium sp. TaxID=376 RepID=UPI001D9D6E3D|nr:exopolysaccharide transport family protein [Bradyrhizobium sp.]MBI5319912.1 lipopolysaccharide biosynthesis protein [Bradyrhizobium sp.]
MRLAFWGADKAKAVVQRAVPKAVPAPAVAYKPAAAIADSGDLDLRALGQALARRRGWIIVPTALALVMSVVAVNLVTPRYKSEARILIDGRENVFLRPNADRTEERSALDAEAVTSQVQLVLSRELAREVIARNRLAERPEFDPVLTGVSPLKSLLAMVGIGRDPFAMTPEERVLDAYYERLTAYAVDKSRVIVIEFQSRDPELAAKVANSIADGYLVLQQAARQQQAKSAGQWLLGEIDSLRTKVSEAESRAEDFRSRSSLFIGTNNTTLSNQQMGEINTQLNNARALKSDAENKAKLIREMLQGGKPIEASEVLNSELIRRLSEQRATLRGQLAEQSSTLLDGHPRIKELKAQLADLDRQLRDEASKVSRSLENDARIAGGRVDSLSASLDQMKKLATSTNSQDVQLRALEREAKAQRDLLESYLAKYREATARENIDSGPSDGRIISRATVSNIPAYPKKLPIVLIATLATLLLTSGLIVTGELLRMTAPRAIAATPVLAPATEPVFAEMPAAAPVPAQAAVEEQVAGPAAARMPEPEPAAVAVAAEPNSDEASIAPSAEVPPLNEIEHLAAELCAPGDVARKITVLGTAAGEDITLTALTLARLMAGNLKVALVDLAASSSILADASVDANAPGLAELMQGEASFTQVITKDRFSRVHLVGAGRPGFDRALLQSPRLLLAIDALMRVYDRVLLDAGTASDLPAELLTALARAVVVPDAAMEKDARAQMAAELTAAGFSAVTMLSKACQPEKLAAGPRVVAA